MAATEMNQLKAVQKLLRSDEYGYSDSSDVPIPEKNLDVGELLTGMAAELPEAAAAFPPHMEAITSNAVKMPRGEADDADETVKTLEATRNGFWKLWTVWRDTYPEQGRRAAIASDLLERMGRTTNDVDSKRPIHVVCDWYGWGFTFVGLLAEFLDDPASRVLPPGSKLTMWAGSSVAITMVIPFIAPPVAFAGGDSKSVIDVAAATDLQKVHLAAVAGPYLPGKGGGVGMRGLFGLPDGNFPDWFVGTAEGVRTSVLPWFPATAAALDGDGFEKLETTAAGLPESVFGHGFGAGYEKRVTWLNTVGGENENPKADDVAIVAELEAEGTQGKTVVYVGFGHAAYIPLMTLDEKKQPYKEFLKDLMNLGEKFVVAVRVAWAPHGTDLSSVGAQKPTELLKSLTEEWNERVPFLERNKSPSPAKIVLYEDWFPQQALFSSQKLKQSRLIFVTHGGASSISEALRAKIPMVTVPAMLEQAMNARHLCSNGLAVDASAAGFKHGISFNSGHLRLTEKLVLPGSSQSIAAAVITAANDAQKMRGKIDEFAKAMGERSLMSKQLADMLAAPSGA
eukprot:g10689.t1